MPNHSPLASQGALVVKDQSASYIEMQVSSLVWEDSLEEGTATHSGILTWRIPWTDEPGGLQSIGSRRVEHDQSNLAHSPLPFHIEVNLRYSNILSIKISVENRYYLKSCLK